MPLYEYRCATCGHQFEELVRHDQHPTACPKCAAASLTKLVSVFAVGGSAQSPTLPCGPEACPTCPGASAGVCGLGEA